jgi:fibronectin-binding autotransporter adhesin
MRKLNNNKAHPTLAGAAGMAIVSLAMLPTPLAKATTYTWNGTGTSWNSSSSWTPNGTPGSGDYATFNAGGVSSAQTVDLNGNQSITGLTANSSGSVDLVGGTGDQTLTFTNPTGENMQLSNSGPFTVGSNTAGQAVNILLDNSGSFTFVMDAQGPVSILNNISGAAATNNTTTLNLPSHGGNTNSLTMSGVLSDGSNGGSLALAVGFGGTLYLTGSNTFTGGMTISSLVNVASLSNYGVASAIGARTSAQDANQDGPGAIGLYFSGGTLQYTGSTAQSTNRQIRLTNSTTNTIDASGSSPGATVSFTYDGSNTNLYNAPGTRTLNLVGSNTGRNIFSIGLTDQASSGGQTSVVKAGTGTWVLNNPSNGNSYSGTTSVNAGTLLVDSAIINSPFTVSSAATLAGDGSTGSLTVNTGGILAPGDNAIGGTTLTATGGTTLGNNSILNFTLGTPDVAGGTLGSDLLKTTTLALGTGISVNVTPGAGFGQGTYSLIDYSGALTGNFTGWTVTGLPGGQTGVFSIGTDNGGSAVQLTIASVPEPVPLALLVAAGGGLLLLGRQRRGQS